MARCLPLTENIFILYFLNFEPVLLQLPVERRRFPEAVLTADFPLGWSRPPRQENQTHWCSPTTSKEQTNLQPAHCALFPGTVVSKTRIIKGFRRTQMPNHEMKQGIKGAALTLAEFMEKKRNPWSYSSKYKHLGKQLGSLSVGRYEGP